MWRFKKANYTFLGSRDLTTTEFLSTEVEENSTEAVTSATTQQIRPDFFRASNLVVSICGGAVCVSSFLAHTLKMENGWFIGTLMGGIAGYLVFALSERKR